MEFKRWRWWNCKFCFKKFRISFRVFRKLKKLLYSLFTKPTRTPANSPLWKISRDNIRMGCRSREWSCSYHCRQKGLFWTKKVDSVLHEQSNQQHIIHEFKIRDFELQNLLPDQIYTGIRDHLVFENTARSDSDNPCPWMRCWSLFKLFFNQKIGQPRIRVTIILPLEYCVK